jgi:hypothetical protein
VPPRPTAPPRPARPPFVAAGTDEDAPPTLLLRPVTGPPAGPLRRLIAGPLHLVRAPGRSGSGTLVAPLLCLVLGAGLLGGSAAGAWLTDNGGAGASGPAAYEAGRSLWRDVPVDGIFPAELTGEGAGPGGADRRWLRVAVAPDSGCAEAFDPLLADALAPVGCHRLVRATYLDETETSVTTVGLLFTKAEAGDMRALRERFGTEELGERPDLMPGGYGPAGTLAEGFGDEQRASWTVRVMTDIPVVVYAVTGFADGRAVTDPEPAAEATAVGAETTVALAGLGHDAEGIADRVESGLRRSADLSGGPR